MPMRPVISWRQKSRVSVKVQAAIRESGTERSRGDEALVARLLRPWKGGSATCANQFAPPGVGDPTQLLELSALTAPERRTVTPCYDYETRQVEWRPGDVPRTDQPCAAAGGKRQACSCSGCKRAQPGGTRPIACLGHHDGPGVSRVEHRAPVAGEGGADAFSEQVREFGRADRLDEKHGCIERIATGIRHLGDAMAQILHLYAGKLR